MSHAFADITSTPASRAARTRDGSRANRARRLEGDGELFNDRPGEPVRAFTGAQRRMFFATVCETGWPYLQHRGGPRGFMKVLDDRSLAFADQFGNRQFISVGSLAVNDRVALILMDCAQRIGLKLLGRLAVKQLAADDALASRLVDPGYHARPQRALLITVGGFDWNCPQQIPVRIEAEEVQRGLDERDLRITALEARLTGAAGRPAGPASGPPVPS